MAKFKKGSTLPGKTFTPQESSGNPSGGESRGSSKGIQKPSTDEYLGFGNESSSKAKNSLPTKSQPKVTKPSTSKPAQARTSAAATASLNPAKAAEGTVTGKGAGLVEKAASAKGAPGALGKSVLKTPASAGTSSIRKESTELSNANGKRPAATETPQQERKISFSTLPKIQKKTSVASPQSPDRAEISDSAIVVEDEERPPRWYKTEPMPSTRKAQEADVLTLLQRLNRTIGKHNVDNTRDTLHELPFVQVNKSLLKGNRMLHDGPGLSALFSPNSTWPYDIRADAKETYNKWCRQIFETDLLRGILLKASTNSKKEGGNRNQDKIIPGYAGKVDFHAYGNNELSNGQWFPTQLTTVRDGAHGATQGGISGKRGEGAYSCIMTGQSGYPDQDNCEQVHYCGTDSNDGNVTDRTQMLLDSMNNNRPVRFIRKSTLQTPWAPAIGYRYDGLYEVKDFEILKFDDNPKAARHRFRLVRCPGQDPVRGGAGPESRPTEQEIRRYKDDKHFR